MAPGRTPAAPVPHAAAVDPQVWAPLHHVAELLRERRRHRSPEWRKEQNWSLANGVTATRVVAATAVLLVAAVEGSHLLLLAGLLVGWIGDVTDGAVARARKCETILGAQLDSLADRVCAIWVLVAVCVVADGEALVLVASGLVWFQFGVLDHFLSNQFLRFDLWSADEMWTEDERVWRLNWSPIAKIASNVPLALLAIGGIASVGAIALSIMLIAARSPSYAVVARRARLRLTPTREGRLTVPDDRVRPSRGTHDRKQRHWASR